jgi:hypothetical protein
MGHTVLGRLLLLRRLLQVNQFRKDQVRLHAERVGLAETDTVFQEQQRRGVE